MACFSKKNFKSEPSYHFSNKYCKQQDELESEIESSKLRSKTVFTQHNSKVLLDIISKNAQWQKNTNYFPLLPNNKFVFDFKEKSEIFNQCSLIPNSGTLPSASTLLIHRSLHSFQFADNIKIVINNQDETRLMGMIW